MRAFTLTTLAALAVLLIARVSPAQDAANAWVKVSPEGEKFVALMPARPAPRDVSVEAGGLRVAGRSYAAAGAGGATYTILALDDPHKVGERLIEANRDYVSAQFGGEAVYLDAVAEVAWEAFLRPELDRLRREKVQNVELAMDYRREFELAGRPAREYFVKLQKAQGPLYVCADGARVYVVAALGPASQSSQLTRFVESFSPEAEASSPARDKPPADTGPGVGVGVGPGRGVNTGGGTGGTPIATPGGGVDAGTVDYGRVFMLKEVTQKAVILSKPDPGFTEEARKFTVTGVIRIRAVLNRTGEVTNLTVVKGLPHGLTRRAVNAARGIKFTPAQKDGRAVSQFVTFEYNFNIY